MKTLKFNHATAKDIKAGKKTVTWRFNEDKDISVNDEIMLIDKVNPKEHSTWEAFGTALVTKIIEKRFGDITAEDEKEDGGYPSREEMFETYRSYYGPDVNESTPVSVIHFDYRPLKEKPLGTLEQMRLDEAAEQAIPKAMPQADTEKGVVKAEASVELHDGFPKEVKLYADGGSRGNPGPSAGGFALLTLDDEILVESGKFLGLTTNNQAEYHSLKGGLEAALRHGVRIVNVYMDSLLVVNQMKGIFKVKNRDLWPIHQAIKTLVPQFEKVTFQHVPRELNKLADSIVNKTLDEVARK